MWPILNDVATGQCPAYPDLQPQRFNHPPERVREAAAAAIGSLKGWALQADTGGGEALHAIRTTRLFRFKDDITVSIEPAEAGWCQVQIRSKSRVGKGDFGQNARNIRELQAALSARL